MSQSSSTSEPGTAIQSLDASDLTPILEGTAIPDAPVATEKSPAPALEVAEPATDAVFLWLRRGDQLIVGLLVIALLGLLGVHWLRLSRWGSVPVELTSLQPREYYYSLDINTATWIEWTQLDGIGETLARRIVADREERGPFRNPGEVGRVKGIGPKLFEKIQPYLRGGTENP